MPASTDQSQCPIAITMGDPAGVGPEILARTIAGASAGSGTDSASPVDQDGVPWVLVGSRWALEKGAQCVPVQLPPLNTINNPQEAKSGWNLLDLGIPEPDDFRFGEVQASCGEVAVRAVEWAANQCLQGQLAAMVTAPINKEAIHAAGYVNDIGHQEILARLAGVSQTATILMTPGLRVVHLSTHKSLAEAVRFVTRDEVLAKLHLIHNTLSQWG